MKILITGGAGFLGTQLARALLRLGHFRGQPIERLTLADRVAPAHPEVVADARVAADVGDLLQRMPALLAGAQDVVFHLASAVSAECEADFDLGLRSNLDATRALLDGLRQQAMRSGQLPVLFFSSSVAVFGSDPGIPLPAVIRDDTFPTPQSSYGAQKFICEQLIAEYTRKDFLDGRVARLMTVSVRPGRPNGAASSFLSGIIREPLAGLPAVCPVDLDTAVALASPANTVAGILAVAQADREALGGRTAINLPALTVTVRQMLQALEAVAGKETAALVTLSPDPAIARIVGGWPAHFDSPRAAALGLKPDASYRAVIEQYIADNKTTG
ncbi:NAD-dependent epimerase [Bordetella sp. H567]|uniref:D-erythronate dehydrogenase n=1 Tax=Bordetella sp. H567 TaxID=1697043 RepID=UPI00081C8BCC|nr:D-erythronate dehydrogenase [Bordetella sp. H567]AOB33445.1 NAD-dependent epimerase [Bordetella sp. H567]